MASADELIAAQTEKLRLLKLHRQGLAQQLAKEMKAMPPAQNEDAQTIIDFLLEGDGLRMCGSCEREFGVVFPGASHGECKRHSIALLQQTKKLNPHFDDAAALARINQSPDDKFPPDLSLPQNRELLAQGQKKDWKAEYSKQQAYLQQWRDQQGFARVPTQKI